MSMLREKAQQMPAMESEWTEAIKPVIEGITERFKALTLKGRKVVVVDTGDTDDVVLLKKLLLEECPDYNDQLRKKSDLKSMPIFRDRLTWGGGRQTNYLSEIRGSDNRTPGWLKSFVAQQMPLPWKRSASDQHYLSFQEVRQLQISSNVQTDERYMPSAISSTAKCSTQGQLIDMNIKDRDGMSQIWTLGSAIMYSKCDSCNKPRVIFSLDLANKQQNIKTVENYLNLLPLQCGMPLFAVNSDSVQDVFSSVFVRQSVNCGHEIQTQYYANRIAWGAPEVCVHCGSHENISADNPRTIAGQQVRPQCLECVATKDRVPFGKKNKPSSLFFTTEVQHSQKQKQARHETAANPSNADESSGEESTDSLFQGTLKSINNKNGDKEEIPLSCCAGDLCFYGENLFVDKITTICQACKLKCHGDRCFEIIAGAINSCSLCTKIANCASL